jgi:signal transduction histidine kinase
VLAGALLFFAPYFVRYLGRGIAPPAAGVSVALWLSWELALAAAGMAMVLAAAALVRGPTEPQRPSWIIIASAGWAVLAAVAGLWLWQPYGAWPEWYTFLWLPALAGAIVPAPRRWALFGVAIVAGTAAALVTWGAAVEGRLNLARRDAERLGAEPDPLAIAELERLGQHTIQGGDIRTDADLYAVWSGSPLAQQEYPTVLAAWTPNGDEIAELRLAALDLPTPLLAALARSMTTPGAQVTRLDRLPGVHYVLVARLQSGELLTVGVGPRSRLVTVNRVARFLRGDAGVEPPFAISLSLPKPSETPPGARVHWERVGWAARGHRSIEVTEAHGGTHHVHVLVELRGPWVPLERGTLVVFIDILLITLAWSLSRIVAEGWVPRLPSPALAVASYRGRLATVLAAFFVVPLLVFAVSSVARLGDSAREAGDLLIRQTVRDAAASAGNMPGGSAALAGEVTELGQRLDADLWIYKGGSLAGTSDPVLGELGLVDPLLAPSVYRRLALEDELELTTDARAAGRLTRVGYHVMAEGSPVDQVVLAVPQLVNDEAVRRQEQDLGFTLVLATLVGLVAAVALAGATSRRLARPVSALREAALAVGQGGTPPPFPPDAASEFAPVITAFDRMVLDIRNGRQALEEARRRTAQVLATVATGVVAVDERLAVTMANPRAEELLGARLEPGVIASRATGPLWGPVWEVVAAFIARHSAPTLSREFTLAGRQIRVQLAATDAEGEAGRGCVVALDDTTDLARASRVLAWGEMARQVAHEIKNPLTPIRLGIQHLQRARTAGGRAADDFDRTLRETAERILAEIDRLDAIARAFSRFGAPGAEQLPLEAVDLFAAAREVVQLYALGDAPGIAQVTLDGSADPPRTASARKDEVKEVLVNLVENARNADARRITVRVAAGGLGLAVEDDGRGIAPEALDHVFEPTFSTTSSGSGLGLAIAKRLVENWGGGIAITSVVGKGTTVTLSLKPAFRAGAG